jgi:hypothetical protein
VVSENYAQSLPYIIASVTRGQCYDYNFLQFSTIFGKKWRFSKKNKVMIIFCKN